MIKNENRTAEAKEEKEKNSSKPSEDSKENQNKPASGNNKSKKSSEKTEKSESPAPDDSRARDIFNIETFSYDEGTAQYDENSDDPLKNPFDGF